MRRAFFLVLVLMLVLVDAFAQQKKGLGYFHQAFAEISEMLDCGQPLSVKRAVFLSEWAYLDGTLDYEDDFCKEISRIAEYVRQIIALNHYERYKTAWQFVLCDYFFRPCYGNGRIPYTYDFGNEYPDEDWHHQLTSRTLKTHKGRCHSLPWTFKLIAEELGAEAYIAHAPRHCYIMYRDEDDHYPEDWVNVELTSQQYVPTFWLKEHYEISDSAVMAGTYLSPLTKEETVACQLADLALVYSQKFGRYDEFTLKCVEKSLKHYPLNPTAIILKARSLFALLKQHLAENGNLRDAMTDRFDMQLHQCDKDLKATHWTQETEELRRRWSQDENSVNNVQTIK